MWPPTRDEEARLLFSSAQQATDAPLPPPIADYEKTLDPQRLALIQRAFRHSVVGGPETVAKGVADFIARYRPDEVIVTAQIYRSRRAAAGRSKFSARPCGLAPIGVTVMGGVAEGVIAGLPISMSAKLAGLP